ncbi:MAG: hypothetical protein ACLFV0_05645 [Nitriliruptoraceae bacterium]
MSPRPTAAPLVTHRPPQVDPVLRTTEGVGAPSQYRQQVKAGQPLDPGVLDALTTWAAARTATRAAARDRADDEPGGGTEGEMLPART